MENFKMSRSWEEQEEHDRWFPFLRVSSVEVATRSARRGSNSSACVWGRQMGASRILDHITVTILLYLKLLCISIRLLSTITQFKLVLIIFCLSRNQEVLLPQHTDVTNLFF